MRKPAKEDRQPEPASYLPIAFDTFDRLRVELTRKRKGKREGFGAGDRFKDDKTVKPGPTKYSPSVELSAMQNYINSQRSIYY